MRPLLASLVAVIAVAFAVPSFAQDTPPSTAPAAPVKHIKHVKHKTTASASSCSAMKSKSAKSACLKRLHAHAKTHKTSRKIAAAMKKPAASPQLPPPAETTPAPQSQSQSVAVPPLPQKTI